MVTTNARVMHPEVFYWTLAHLLAALPTLQHLPHLLMYQAAAAAVPLRPRCRHLFLGSWRRLQLCGRRGGRGDCGRHLWQHASSG